MKKKWLLITISSIFCLVLILTFQEFTQAQAPGGGNRQAGGGAPSGMMMVMQILPLESEWTQISFAMDVSDDALIKARKAFKDAWTKRKAITDKAESAGDDADARRAMRTDLEKIKTELDTKLKGILTPKQIEDLAKWEKENQNRFRQRQSGAPGGGQPGGNRPQR
jgi:Spy/CpxP family protein refolding chaperone